MQVTGKTKIKLFKSIKEYFRGNGLNIQEVLEFEPGEEFIVGGFIKNRRNLIIQLDANIYITNKRVAILTGNDLLNIFYRDITKIDARITQFWETLFLMNKTVYIKIEYKIGADTSKIEFCAVQKAVGGPSQPNNEHTTQYLELIKANSNS